jgi:tetratricopeptide (TPR) repeat protein
VRGARAWPAALLLACTPAPRTGAPAEGGAATPDSAPPRAGAQEAFLATLVERARAAPDDPAAHKAAGLAAMRLTLAGTMSLQETAERHLERAFELDPSDRELTRALGRFYNLRAVAGDGSKADLQVRVYAAHLGPVDPRALGSSDFVAYSFSKLGEILTLRNRGKLLGALSTIEEFEEILRARTEQHPDDIEMFALAGNFAFFFAGNVPFERERRIRDAVSYFEVLRARWDELRPGARDEVFCPNTRENFMFELAEGWLALAEPERARPIYRGLTRIDGVPTRPKEQIAAVAAERLRNLERYAGDLRLMPPWPGDAANCVVCHSWTAEISIASLFELDR